MYFRKCLLVLLVLAIVMGSVPAFADYNMPYYIDVDLTNQIVTIYNSKDHTIARQMLCSAGTGDRTPTGTWYMPEKDRSDERTEWYWMPNAYTWVKYATKFYYAYFFHSIPYNDDKEGAINKTALSQFGTPASHGCIRLLEEDAYFIAKNCLRGTRVRIFYSGEEDNNLRALLYEGTFIEGEGKTYTEFLGISENDLGRGCSGSKVLDLQYRLNDLGFYDGGFDSVFGDEMIGAVKAVQQELGMLQTGIATEELLDVIYSENPPMLIGETTVSAGSSGPVVHKLQDALKQLGMYEGAMDSVYDADVEEAVKRFQGICGLTVDGVASPEVQYALYYVLYKVHHEMGGTDFSVSFETEEMVSAVIDSKKANINVRSKADTDSAKLGVVKHGDQVTVVATQDEWAQIICEKGVGYIYKKYLSDRSTSYNYIAKYTSGANSYTLGNSMEEKLAGSNGIMEELKNSYSKESSLDALLKMEIQYASVNTGSDDVKLNLRAKPTTEAAVLDMASNGAGMRVLEQGAEWTKAVYNGQLGYLMSSHLNFWQGSSDDEVQAIASQRTDVPAPTAKTISDGSTTGVRVYAGASFESSVIGRLPADTEVKVLSAIGGEGWMLIDYEGNQGFMHYSNLNYQY